MKRCNGIMKKVIRKILIVMCILYLCIAGPLDVSVKGTGIGKNAFEGCVSLAGLVYCWGVSFGIRWSQKIKIKA